MDDFSSEDALREWLKGRVGSRYELYAAPLWTLLGVCAVRDMANASVETLRKAVANDMHIDHIRATAASGWWLT